MTDTPRQELLTHLSDGRDAPPAGAHAWLQWKGTNACMDVQCVCGATGHVDSDFTYYLRCTACDRMFHVSGYVRLLELSPAETAEAARSIVREFGPDVPWWEL